MGADYLVEQIPDVVVDAVSDLVGKTKAKKLVAKGLVSLGKSLADLDLLDGWFGKLANRVVDTRYMIRSYEPKNNRKILRNEHEFGAFVQRVYYTDMPDATENPTWATPDSGTYSQESPYDVEGSVGIKALIYGGKGTWTLEFIRPLVQIKNAFTSLAEMDAFIAGLYTYVDNKIKLQEEAITMLAANTGIANAIVNGLFRDLLSEYNLLHDNDVITREEALRDAEFLKYASMEISRVVENIGMLTTVFNAEGYETYTSPENLVLEMLTQFEKASEVYLQADTFHNDLVALPNFETIPYWQGCGSRNFAFDDCSSIHIEHDGFILDSTDESDTGEVNVDGIIAFMHDVEYVASTFNNVRQWQLPNPRSEVMVHGHKAEKGFAVDKFMNAFVFMIGKGNGAITVTEGSTLKYKHAYAGVENEITVPTGDTPTATGITFKQVGTSDVYTFTPATNDAIEITVA